MPTPVLALDEALDLIRDCNRNPTFQAAEALMHERFSSTSHVLSPRESPQCVVLLDAVWATQMFRDPGATDRVIGAIRDHADSMRHEVESLDNDALTSKPSSVIEAADRLLPIILDAPDESGKKGKQHYSFACKFLHWTTRVHFPITDGRARKAINTLQRRNGISPRITMGGGEGGYRDDYKRWILFYSRLIGDMSKEERDCLREADWESQNPDARHSNSLLRIWDKVFYQLG